MPGFASQANQNWVYHNFIRTKRRLILTYLNKQIVQQFNNGTCNGSGLKKQAQILMHSGEDNGKLYEETVTPEGGIKLWQQLQLSVAKVPAYTCVHISESASSETV